MFERSTSEARPDEQGRHRCAWGARCVSVDIGEIDPETKRPVRRGALITDPPLCPGCLERLRFAVKGLPLDYQRLGREISGRRTTEGAHVAMSTELEIPLNAHREMLQARIVEVADRAAEIVEAEFGMTGKARHRGGTPRGFEGRGYRSAGASGTGGPLVTIDNSVKLVLGALDALIEAEAQPHMMWLPLPDSDEEYDRYQHGQPRAVVELTGLDVARQIVDLSHDVYMELGRARLREDYTMACPAWDRKQRRYCGAETVGRDDGSGTVNCETCGARWTEEDFRVLVGWEVDQIEAKEELMLQRWLLAEAYWRLDQLHKYVATLKALDLKTVTAVTADGPQQVFKLIELITTQVAAVLTMGSEPHSVPDDRQFAAQGYEQKKQLDAIKRRQELATR